jgi:beta-glucosidase
VGYRYYDKKELAPLFPFGHGLSYTSFAYSNLKLDAAKVHAGDPLTVSVDVTNTGAVSGKEVVQLYVSDVKSLVARPMKELKAFRKVALQPGETQTVSFVLNQEAFWFFNTVVNGWAVEPGEFEILVGASSRDIRLGASVEVTLSRQAASRPNTGMTVNNLGTNPAAWEVIAKYVDPGIFTDISMLGMTLVQVSVNHPHYITPWMLQAIADDLSKI